MFWENLTRLEINQWNKNSPLLLPLAAIEQHGDHLPVSTDLLINRHFCDNLNHGSSDQILILPPIAVTCSGHHLDLGGTLTVSHTTFLNYVQDILKGLFQQGFKKVILFNSHGGNQAIGQSIIENTGLLYPQAHLFMISWWKIVREELTKLNESGFGGVGHACEFETSIVAAIDPKLVRKEKIKDTKLEPMPDFAKGDLLNAPAVGYHRTMQEFTGDGVFGKPEYYSIEKGKKITEIVVKELTEIIKKIKDL